MGILIPLLLILLIALNYKIWAVSYYSGSFEENIIKNATNIEHCITTDNTNTTGRSKNTTLLHFIKLLSNSYFYNIAAAVFSVSIILVQLKNKGIRRKKDATLVSLCVRMDD